MSTSEDTSGYIWEKSNLQLLGLNYFLSVLYPYYFIYESFLKNKFAIIPYAMVVFGHSSRFPYFIRGKPYEITPFLVRF